jgi:O-ureido-D-serine cyclo-ligase
MSEMISRGDRSDHPLDLRIALVTTGPALDLDLDMPLLVSAFESAGVATETPCWTDGQVDWAGYNAALLRSTWDYVDRIEEFLDWCDRCAARTLLLNPPAVVRWNIDKHYLCDLARAGVPVVPTRFVEPGEDAGAPLQRFLAGGPEAMSVGDPGDFAEFVVKPAIGAGSRDALRYARSEVGRARLHVQRLLEAGRSVMLQPYLDAVDEQGETAVLYLAGRFSHAARKGPLLRPGSALVEGLFAPEDIRPRVPAAVELEVAAAAYAAIPFEAPAYARIDLIRDRRGAPHVLELELTEPSLFLEQAPGAAEAFARRIAVRLRAPAGREDAAGPWVG